jgi:hypothetical protein
MNILKDTLTCLFSRLKVCAVDHFFLEKGKEALTPSIVAWVSDA